MVQDSAYADEWTHVYVAELSADGSAGDAVRWSPDGLQVENVVWSPDSRAVAYGARPSPVLRTRYHGATYVQRGPEAEAEQLTTMDGPDGAVAWDDGIGVVVAASGHLIGTFNRQSGRIALQFASQSALPTRRLTALGAHAGLSTDR